MNYVRPVLFYWRKSERSTKWYKGRNVVHLLFPYEAKETFATT